jgi:arginase
MPMEKPIVLVNAPSNLGLRPLRPGHEPGTWRAPEALSREGLKEALTPVRSVDLPRPEYKTELQSGTRIRNGPGIRAFNIELGDVISAAIQAHDFPVVVGGDCSILLGALAGVRKGSPLSLVHIDGHSDFRHPGNYDADAVPAAAAGMDLALATGRGERLLTHWPGVPSPLVPDERVVQIGERESRDTDFAWPDIADTAINRIDVFAARSLGAERILECARNTLDRSGLPFWLHFDVDVLDQTIMPAVDSPGSPGIEPDDLIVVLADLVADERCAGLTVTIFDPDIDRDGSCARLLVSLLREVFV